MPTITYDAPGGYLFTVPTGCSSVHLEVYGAEGEGGGFTVFPGGDTTWDGGLGGGVECDLPVSVGDVLNLTVADAGSGQPGFGDGGLAPYANAGNGGGASSVFLNGTTLADAVVVAGGGGGGSEAAEHVDSKSPDTHSITTSARIGSAGGDGGNPGADGESQTATGGSGTGAAGTDAGDVTPDTPPTDGDFLDGGNGGDDTGVPAISIAGGGGGGGWPGGGGGGTVQNTPETANVGTTYGAGGGGGGSNYAAPATTNVVHSSGVRSGDGLIVLTYEQGSRWEIGKVRIA